MFDSLHRKSIGSVIFVLELLNFILKYTVQIKESSERISNRILERMGRIQHYLTPKLIRARKFNIGFVLYVDQTFQYRRFDSHLGVQDSMQILIRIFRRCVGTFQDTVVYH